MAAETDEAEILLENLDHVEANDSLQDLDDFVQIPTGRDTVDHHRSTLSKFKGWLQGPRPSRPFKITPFFPNFQPWPVQPLLRLQLRKNYLLLGFCLSWLMLFTLTLYHSAKSCSIEPYGTPVMLSCTSRFWENSIACGLNGRDCEPFTNASFAFRCPSSCETAKVWSTYFVGAQDIVYRNLVIGGPTDDGTEHFYRGDSFICSAALHAGVTSNTYGGAGIVSLVGERSSYQSSNRHGLSSMSFPATFPQSFTLTSSLGEQGNRSSCADPRWKLAFLSILTTIFISLFSSGSSAQSFYATFTITFLTISLAIDPPYVDNPPHPTDRTNSFSMLISSSLQAFLPSVPIAFILYHNFISRTLSDLPSSVSVSKVLLWLFPQWVGALNAYTFDTNLPIQRLTPHDLATQPGAIPTLIFIILVLIFIAIGQIWCLRLEGRLIAYLKLYIGFTLVLLALLAVSFVIPTLHLRIHHYILALLLIPGTAIQTRPSLLYQGLLVGLFISGVARWGFASILETDAVLFQDSGGVDFATPGSGLGQSSLSLPFPTFEGIDNLNLIFNLSDIIHDSKGRVSVRVNDVERYRGAPSSSDSQIFNWTTNPGSQISYFRIAPVREDSFGRDVIVPGGYGGGVGLWSHTNGTWRWLS